MKIAPEKLEEIIFGKTGFRRFTQDSSILPDVWMEYGDNPYEQADLLITPTWGSAPGDLAICIERRLAAEREKKRVQPRSKNKKQPDDVAYNGSTIAVRLYFDELIRVILPLTNWWKTYFKKNDAVFQKVVENEPFRYKVAAILRKADWDVTKANAALKPEEIKLPAHLVWLIKLVGVIAISQNARLKKDEDHEADKKKDEKNSLAEIKRILDAFAGMMKDVVPVEPKDEGVLWAINLNRPATAMIWKSTTAVKADASRTLFNVKCDDIRWAVIDSGIDATHPAFRLRDADGKPNDDIFASRVVKTFDFTMIRMILSRSASDFDSLPDAIKKIYKTPEGAEFRKSLQARLAKGRSLDWDILAPILEIPHKAGSYRPPVFEHGTHVAGIIAADWRQNEPENDRDLDIKGVCPDLALYDLRVLDDNGESDEFSVLAALQFAQYINTNSEYKKLHGVNMSFSIRHKVKNFACGCTPVCEEAERMVNSGLVVVAAAGNDGYNDHSGESGRPEGYRSISITDPGNAEAVITVGATHRDSPHTYGVSYFSSRGPTGDGRIKPDIVAPGEKIISTVPDSGSKPMDGTSMAAPHVSGAAALLIGRHRELIGKPVRVKQILCKSATDLGRERYFQGHGMLDILRAMQSV